MSKQIEKNVLSQAIEAEPLRKQVYIDPVSLLGNRSFFTGQLDQWLQDSAKGGVALLKAKFITNINEELGYESRDAVVKELADQLKATINYPATTIARINTEEFAFIFPNIESDRLELMARSIVHNVQDMRSDPANSAPLELALGLVYNENKISSREILSLVDNALSQAMARPDTNYAIVSDVNSQVLLGKQQWKMLVEEAINNHHVEFKFQSASLNNDQIFHKEVLSSIEKEGTIYTANQYLYALEQLNIGYIFDQFVIESMISNLENGYITDTLAINLTISSVLESNFIHWLNKILLKYPTSAGKLHFELPETCFISHQYYTALICHTIRSCGSDFGVDNYGRHFHSLNYINEFRPKYVKLDYLHTHQIEYEKQRYTLASISRTAYKLGIVTIASRVETKAQLNFLSDNFVEAFQGFIVDK